MIQLRTILKLADNSGAKRLKVLHVHGGSKRRFGYIGDIVSCSVDRADPYGSVKDSQLVKAVIVRTRKEARREDGSYIRFDDNAGVIIESMKNKDPVGSRIFGPIAREIKELGYKKIASLAKELI
ncbi:50S ribosomal protein L14 [Candidatus Beckwithbacteria bacterium CG10_big_fil_rev_8_21_14_0_10_34_10]|uniref:Large ribosomal subunit protein uL14 n=1 Tax=Candidatus Beckwithbacteria bacterium CG10_big_fil_rev_8_21_14_0_10_34_10 TaxID=1974495 RepID=A0A2H0W7S7_9BACT|nr:MAG: 50S ribosomal protein L14 [Candidatus Beckwithbacteria bacterium CG10_big_fil_rev_8_21_14_0_10_34_10]